MNVFAFVLALVISFFLGSIPFGLIIGSVVYGKDIRSVGSGNIGTTNAIRALGFKGGALVFILDFGKGVLSGLIALALFNALASAPAADASLLTRQAFLAVAFFGCIVGHIFSPWLNFKGGKGIAVAVGCLFVTFGPVGACLELLIFGVLVALTRYVSVGSIASALACPLFSIYYCWGDVFAWFLCTIAALLVVWAHRGNIERLLAGTENRIGSKKES